MILNIVPFCYGKQRKTLQSLKDFKTVYVPTHILNTFGRNMYAQKATISLNNLLASHFIGHDNEDKEKYHLLKLDELPHYEYLNKMMDVLVNNFSSVNHNGNKSDIYEWLKNKNWEDDEFNGINNDFKEIFNYKDENVRPDDKHSPNTFRDTFFKMIENSFNPYYSIFVDNGDEDGEYEIHDGKHRAVIKKFLYDLKNKYANEKDTKKHGQSVLF
jgi:hypothetical protein